jgi:hypothetical protein
MWRDELVLVKSWAVYSSNLGAAAPEPKFRESRSVSMVVRKIWIIASQTALTASVVAKKTPHKC